MIFRKRYDQLCQLFHGNGPFLSELVDQQIFQCSSKEHFTVSQPFSLLFFLL